MHQPVTFLTGPTPVERAPRLATALGLGPDDLLVKRDDLIGLGGGGNKVRKLEITCAQALAEGARTLVTTGAAQSNHARLTAAAGAKLGLDVVLVLAGDPPARAAGNLVLNALFGARIVWTGGRAPTETAAATVEKLSADGRAPYLIPFGGTTPASCAGYATAARELLEQVPGLAHVVVSAGSGGTMAGLVSVLGADRVLGVSCGAVPDARATVADLLETMSCPVAADELRIDTGQIGRGYQHLSDTTRAGMELAARTEGLAVDATYVGRAVAGLVAATEDGSIRPGAPTVLLHTGGLPGLFGHLEIG
jgi:D-cysteine desulfhydrase